eukprot:107421-Chlamydomonas_euryale.AAC.8
MGVCCVWASGHGGPNAADFVRSNLFKNLLQHPKWPGDIQRAIGEESCVRHAIVMLLSKCCMHRKASPSQTISIYGQNQIPIEKTAARIILIWHDSQGGQLLSTGVAVILYQGRLIVANVGDSRGVLSRAGQGVYASRTFSTYLKAYLHTLNCHCHRRQDQFCILLPCQALITVLAAVTMTVDHKPNNKDEKERIENAGGVVIWAGTWRVGGVLAVSRAFGDKPLKQFVISTPHVREDMLSRDDEFLILASDGVWDVINNEVSDKFCHWSHFHPSWVCSLNLELLGVARVSREFYAAIGKAVSKQAKMSTSVHMHFRILLPLFVTLRMSQRKLQSGWQRRLTAEVAVTTSAVL